MLFTIAAVLFVLWLLGLFTHVVGSVIHVILVLAVIVFIWGLLTGRRTVV